MPKRILHANVKKVTSFKPRWLIYSTTREYCFKEEIGRGYFGTLSDCGCRECAPGYGAQDTLFNEHPDATQDLRRVV